MQATRGQRSKDLNRFLLLTFYMGRGERFSNRRTIVTVVCLLVVTILGGHRIASYRVNNAELVKPPINDIVRVCPQPVYAVLSSSTQAAAAASIRKPKICITTLTDAAKADALQRLVRWRNFDSLLDMTWPNKDKYCRKHGYDLFNESMTLDTSRPPSWSKILAVRRLLTEEKCEWVFWMDADTVIMNSNKRIEDFLPMPDSGIDLLLTEQKGPSWNAGAWLIRNTPWSLEFLDHWWNMKEFVQPKGLSVSGDNEALKAYLLSMDKAYFDAHIRVPPRCLFNSVAKFLTKEQVGLLTSDVLMQQDWYMSLERYHKGDFVAHVAGTFVSARRFPPVYLSHGINATSLLTIVCSFQRGRQQDHHICNTVKRRHIAFLVFLSFRIIGL